MLQAAGHQLKKDTLLLRPKTGLKDMTSNLVTMPKLFDPTFRFSEQRIGQSLTWSLR